MSLIGNIARGLVGRSLSSFARSWIRGDDVTDAPAARLSEPYAQSAWIRDAVEKVAGEISGRPLKFYQGDREHTDQAFLDWWARPALGPTVLGVPQRLPLGDVLFDLAAWDRLEGEFFIVLDDSWLVGVGARNPRLLPPFLIARPDRMQAILRGGVLEGWRYTDAGGRQLILVPEQVIHRKRFNPYDDFRGLGGLQAARVAAEGAFLTGVYLRNLVRNNGDLGYTVIAKTGVVDDKQREQIVADLRAKRAALRAGQARDLFLSGDITIDRPKEQATGMDLGASRGMSHQEIFVAFGVPPSMAEVKQAYSIGKESDRYQLITGTCRPLGDAIAASLAQLGGRMAGRDLTAELDWDDHPVMVEVRHARIETGRKLWESGMSWQAINDYLDLGMEPFTGWDVGYLPFSVAPVSDPASDSSTVNRPPSTDPATDPDLAETPEEDPDVAKLRLLVLARSRTQRMQCTRAAAEQKRVADEFAMFACECHGVPGTTMKGRDAKEIAHWKTLMAKRRATVKSFTSAFTRVLMAARVETLKKIEANLELSQLSTLSPQLAQRTVAADLLFALDKFSASLRGALESQHKSALQVAGEQLLAELGKDDPFKAPPQAVLEFLQARANKLSNVPQQVYDRVKAALEEGLKAGETQDQLAGRVKGIFNDMADGLARRISLTETGAVYGSGRQFAMQQAGVQWKRWLTSGNANVRAAHALANGQTVPVDEPFEVDGEALMNPGDDAGSAGNVINCHCVSIAVAEGPSD